MIRAAVPATALEAVRRHAPATAEVVQLDDCLELESVDFLVPHSR
jgi:hypothetical protein